jgi:hypothetical protein
LTPEFRAKSLQVAKTSFENVAKFRYLGMKATNENLVHDEINSRST